MTFLNAARIFSLFCETPLSPFFCSPQPYPSSSWTSELAWNFQPLYPIRHLWHVEAGLPFLTWPCFYPCFCSTAITALCGSHWNLSLAHVCRSFAQSCVPNSTATTAAVALCAVFTLAPDKKVNKNVGNRKGENPQNHIEFGMIILQNLCDGTALVKAVARCFLYIVSECTCLV